jgi:hypothetical protein
VQHRQITSESTPGPDNARNEADKQRQQEEEQTTGNDDGGFAETRPPHSFELDGEGDTLEESSKGTEVVKAKASKGKEPVKDTPGGSNGTEVIKTKASKGKEPVKDTPGGSNGTEAIKTKASKRKEPVKDTSKGSKGARVSIAQREAVDRVLKAPDGWNFQILGLKGLQDAEKVPSAYKKLALQVHPDRNRDLCAGSAFQSK